MTAAGLTEAVSFGFIEAKAVQTLPGVAAAEPRRTISARMLIGPNEWRPLILYVVNDFTHMHVATFTSDQGKWPPADRELLIERSGFRVRTMRITNGSCPKCSRQIPGVWT